MFNKTLLWLWLMLVAIPVAFTQSGTLVQSFGENGIRQIDFGLNHFGDDYGGIVKTDAEGKILIAGGSSNGINEDFSIIRLNSNGSLDSTFNSYGKLLIPIGTGDSRVRGLDIDTNGRIVLAGITNTEDLKSYIVIVKLKSDGSFDSTFNGNGKLTVPIEINQDRFGFLLDPDNKILIARSLLNEGNYDFNIMRFNSNGTADETFGGNGSVIVSIGDYDDYAFTLTIDPNNKILVAGSSYFKKMINGSLWTYSKMSIIRLDNNGNLDCTFDNDGKFVFNREDENGMALGESLILDDFGKILIAGNNSILRLNDNGSIDNSFNYDGEVLIPSNPNSPGRLPNFLVFARNGKILSAGGFYNDTAPWGWNFSIICFNTDGTLDITFNENGKLIIPIGNGDDISQSACLDDDDRILIGGYSYNVNNYDFSIARVNTNGSLDNTFSDDGKLLINGNDALLILVDKNNQARRLITDITGRLLVAGFSYNGGANDFSIVRLNANGSLDNTFGSNGKLIIPVGNGDDEGKCLAMDADGKILIAGSSVNDNQKVFSIVRLNSNGNLDTSFDSDGKALISLSDNDFYGANGMAIDSLGKILLVGGSENHFSILRLNSDGTPDFAFDEDGKKIITDGLSGYATCVAIDSNGKILLAGHSWACSGHECGWENFQVIRLNMDGSYDSSFDGDGKLILNFDDPQLKYYINVATSIGTDYNGKIIIAGSTSRQDNVWDNSHWGPGITRLNYDGSLDTTFTTNGKHVFPDFEDYANKFNMPDIQPNLPDDKILIAGSNDGNYSVSRLTYNGGPDSTFGVNGLTQPTNGLCYSMKADSNYIWLAGTDNGDFKIIKLYARNNQHIDFTLPDTVQFGDTTIVLNGTASSGLPVTYTSNNPSIASISFDTLRLAGPGNVAITASQGGDGTFYSADPVSRSLVVKSTVSVIPAYDPDAKIRVYPNPVSNTLFLESPGLIRSVLLTGMEGSVIYESRDINNKSFSMDMSGYKPGSYILTIRFDEDYAIQVQKVFKL